MLPLKVRAAELAIEALEEARAAGPEDVAVRKLRADVALKICWEVGQGEVRGERAGQAQWGDCGAG